MAWERLRSKIPGLRRPESTDWIQILRERHNLTSSDDVRDQALEWLGDSDYAWQGAELAIDRHISPGSLRDEKIREIISSEQSPEEKWGLLNNLRHQEAASRE